MVEKSINFEKEEVAETPDEDNEVDELASYGPQKKRYYESQKVLGKLYRSIDEQKFLDEIEEQSRNLSRSNDNLLEAVWKYVRQKTVLIEWTHCIEFAEDVMER